MAERHVRGAIVNELGAASRLAHELAAVELAAAGVVPSEYGFLSFVGTLQPVTRTKLTEAIGLRRTTVRDIVKRLIERGHLREAPNPGDGRSTLLELTPAGQRIFDAGLPAIERVLDTIDEALGGTLDEHEEAVWRVRTALERVTGERDPGRPASKQPAPRTGEH
jgi:DNA-binding MarR family transcriptional regulator